MGEEIFSKELSTFKKEINFISNLYINKKLPQTISNLFFDSSKKNLKAQIQQ